MSADLIENDRGVFRHPAEKGDVTLSARCYSFAMQETPTIQNIKAREVLDSRGFPTVEVDLALGDSGEEAAWCWEKAMVPSGASTGEAEALELRDHDSKRYLGKGVQSAIANIDEKLTPALIGRQFVRQSLLDDFLNELDGTENKTHIGANAILAVSMAFARAQARFRGMPLFQSLAFDMDEFGNTLPVPLMNVLNGGAHADNQLALQEFMIAPFGFDRFSEALRAGSEVFHHLKRLLKKRGLATSVGDEGGFAPAFGGTDPHEEALSALVQAISSAGYRAGKEIGIALDAAASEFAKKKAAGSSEEQFQYFFEGGNRTAQQMMEKYTKWLEAYPILSIEDGLSEHDWEGWRSLTEQLGARCQLVGDDLFVTNPRFLKKGIEKRVGNSILIKLNQIGTVTETLETIRLAKQSGYTAIVSHRSGETEDVFIAELAVGADCGQIKTGSASRSERLAKYNQLIRIEEQLGEKARFAGRKAFPNLS